MLVLVVEDHPLVRSALQSILKLLDPRGVCAQADRLAVVPRIISEYGKPDLVILDLTLPDGRGAATLKEIQRMVPGVPIVVLSGSAESDYGGLATDLGAAAYIEKSVGMPELLKQLSPYVKAGNEQPPSDIKLSGRQKQLLQLMNDGLSNRDISDRLGISEHTVKVHLWRLYKRLNVRSRSQASHVARSMGWIDATSV